MRFRRAASILFVLLAVFGCVSGDSHKLATDPAHYHHVLGGGFRNPEGSANWKPETFDFLRFIMARFADFGANPPLPVDFVVPLPEAKAKLAALADQPRLTWIGHATFLIGLDGLNILTDPFFSERASPVGFAGPKRFVAPGLPIEDLPPIDLIILSHSHYDHFDEPALAKLAARNPNARVLVPLGLSPWVRRAGFANVRELDWYDADQIGPLTVTAVPAIHRSNRGLFDVNETLWAGYILAGASLKIWFAGDTGMGPVFARDVAPRLGPVDVALVPIGAYLPRDVLRAVHASPEEAVELAAIMGAKTAVGMHWGTLPLGADLPLDTVARFHAAPTEGVDKVLMRIGETRPLPRRFSAR